MFEMHLTIIIGSVLKTKFLGLFGLFLNFIKFRNFRLILSIINKKSDYSKTLTHAKKG